jgi:hypothetical protein
MTTAATTIALGAIAAPAATAGSRDSNSGGRPAIVHIDSHGGFDWLDAGIGAAGGIALAIVGVGGSLVISHHRSHPHRVTQHPQGRAR